MDWKEDLKFTFMKSAAKKGRRANQEQQQQKLSSPSKTSPLKQIPSSSFPPPLPEKKSSKNPLKSIEKEDSFDIDLDLSLDSPKHDQKNLKTPPKKITTGWTENIGLKSGKNRKKSINEDEKLSPTEMIPTTILVKDDDIPIIPDLDDIQDEILMNEIVEPPSITVNRVVTLKELDSDLLKQSEFSQLEDIDLSILTKRLLPLEMLEESDEVWDWDQTFTQVTAEINAENEVLKNKSKGNNNNTTNVDVTGDTGIDDKNDEPLFQTQYLS